MISQTWVRALLLKLKQVKPPVMMRVILLPPALDEASLSVSVVIAEVIGFPSLSASTRYNLLTNHFKTLKTQLETE